MRITFNIPEFTRNERNSHCDVLHIAPVRVANLVLGRFRWLPRVSRGTAENSVQCPREAPWEHHGRTRGTDGNIERACVVRYFRQKHDGKNHYETNDLCKSFNSMIVSFHILV